MSRKDRPKVFALPLDAGVRKVVAQAVEDVPVSERAAKRLSGQTLVIRGGLLVLGVLLAAYGAFVSLGRQRFTRGSWLSEAHVTAAQVARSMAACIETKSSAVGPGGDAIPESTPWVPEDPKALHGAGYQSVPSDWLAPAFVCAGFRLEERQHFQFRWEKVSPQSGMVQAGLDLDEDGRMDAPLYVKVDCEASKPGAARPLTCAIGRVETAPFEKGRRSPHP